MTPSEPQESDPFDTRPSLPAENLQTNWPGLDPSTPYPLYGISTPPPPLGIGVTSPEKPRRTYATQMIVIGLLSLAVVLLSLIILSLHQQNIIRFFANMPATSATKTQSPATDGVTTAGGTTTTPGNTSTSSPQQHPPTTAPSPSLVGTATTSTTGTTPTATNTPALTLTVTFTCQNVSGGHGTPGPSNAVQICVQTSPNAQLTIAATRCNGHSDDNLKSTSANADSTGNMQWSWNMQDPGSCGQEHVIVTAKTSSGQTAQNAVDLSFTH